MQFNKNRYEIILSSGQIIRITKSMLGKRTGYTSMLDKHIEKLPITSQLLVEICESVEMFQMRRIKLLVQESDSEIKLWRIFCKAGIRKKYQDTIKDNISKDMQYSNENAP